MKDVKDLLIRYLVCHLRLFEAKVGAQVFDPRNKSAADASVDHGTIAHVYLALYLTPHSDNPYYGRVETLATFTNIMRGLALSASRSLARSGTIDMAEWPPYIVCRGLELVGEKLPFRVRDGMRKLVVRFVEQVAPRPFFFTAPNHEIWKLATMAIAGRVLGHPEWIRQAEFQTCQILAYQTPEGFWEEGRHHGPAMQYGAHMLAGLALILKETGNMAIREATVRQARFLARWCFPDGVVVGAFDGRRPTVLGQVVPGFELVPEGPTYLRRCLSSWVRAGWLDPSRREVPLYRRPFKGDYVAAESLLYYSEPGRKTRKAIPLVMDRDGATLQNHSPFFSGVLGRRGPWAVALSSQISDVPKDTQWVFRLERQNRIEIWHERASVVVGGGHSLVTTGHPVYNVWVDTGYSTEPSPEDYAHHAGPAGSPAMALRRSKYYARAAFSGVDDDLFWLELVFAHATVRFEIVPRRRSLVVRYSYRAMGVKELRVALAMMLWEGAFVRVDGKALKRAPTPFVTPLRGKVVVECPAYGTRTTLIPPRGGHIRAIFPLRVMQSYHAPDEKELLTNPYAIALVETVLKSPRERGTGIWRLQVAPI